MAQHELDYDDLPEGYFDEDEHCDHEEYETDVCIGRATCCYCSHSWYLTTEEVNAELDRQAAYWEWAEQQNKPWNRFKEWIRGKVSVWRPRLTRRKTEPDDEIPF